jgi:ABC-type nickel/cobalt efflux system permease component RcnA
MSLFSFISRRRSRSDDTLAKDDNSHVEQQQHENRKWCVGKWTQRVAIVVLTLFGLFLLFQCLRRQMFRFSKAEIRHARRCVRSSTQSLMIAQQSNSPVVSLIYTTYALAYLTMAQDVLPDRDLLTRMSGVDIGQLLHALEKEQLKQQQKIHTQCPSLQPDGIYTVMNQWMGRAEPTTTVTKGSVV